MRLLSFTLPNDPLPRVGVLAHDGARVVDLTAIGVPSLAGAAARVGELARVSSHLLHMPGAVAHAPAGVRLLAPARRLAAVYDSATGVPAVLLAATAESAAETLPLGPGASVPLAGGAELGVGVACVMQRRAARIALADVDAHVAGVALVCCWRAGAGRIEAAVVGPWLVTLDELVAERTAPLTYALTAALAVNGEPVRGGSWEALTAKLARAVVDAAERNALEPGDAVAVATFELTRTRPDPAGGPARLGDTAGDDIVVEAERLGALRVRVAPALGGAAG